jgi:Domain of unknown function (DUF4404)
LINDDLVFFPVFLSKYQGLGRWNIGIMEYWRTGSLSFRVPSFHHSNLLRLLPLYEDISMDHRQLLESLESLHAELASRMEIDAETRERLGRVTGDIQRLLNQAEVVSREDVEPVHDSVRDLVLRIESEHPSLTSVLNQLASGLSNLGI